MKQFLTFLNSLKTEKFESLIESIKQGFTACFEVVPSAHTETKVKDYYVTVQKTEDGWRPVVYDREGTLYDQGGFPYPNKEQAELDAKLWAQDQGYEFKPFEEEHELMLQN